MTEPREVDPQLAGRLVLDELFDLSLYESLRDVASGDLRSILDQLIPIEARHLAFWQDFFDLPVSRLARSCIGVISKRVWGVSV